MKKILLVAAMLMGVVAASAQEKKFAYVDFSEIVQLMPEMDSARVKIAAQEKEASESMQMMYQEYQTKATQFQQKQASWTPAIRDSKMKELQDIEGRMQEFQQILQQELQQSQAALQAPIVEKAQKAVQNLAKAKGVIFVFEKGSLLYFDESQAYDLTKEVRKAVNIPEGRTLEALQAELQAQAQAAQAAAAKAQ